MHSLTLQDKYEISEIYAIYARAIDEKRYDLLAEVFAPDASLHYEVGPHQFDCSGKQAKEHFSAFLNLCYWTNHLIGTPMIEQIKNVFATARVTATHLQKDGLGNLHRWILRGSYHDVFIQQGSRWKIARRVCICTDSEGEFLSDGAVEFSSMSWADPALISND
jgi:hypothetical protein